MLSFFFHVSLGPWYVLLGEVTIQVLCPFFNWIVCIPGVESCEFFFFFFKILFIYFQREGKGGRKREKHQCVVASHVVPTGDLAQQPRHVP